MTTITKRKQLIKTGFNKVKWAVDDLTHRKYADELLALEKGYEKSHRAFCDGRNLVLSANDCAKYYAVHHILDALKNGTRHDVKSYIYIKQSIFLAESLVENYRFELEHQFKDFDTQAFFDIQDQLYQEVA
jgi:hypothetical protein